MRGISYSNHSILFWALKMQLTLKIAHTFPWVSEETLDLSYWTALKVLTVCWLLEMGWVCAHDDIDTGIVSIKDRRLWLDYAMPPVGHSQPSEHYQWGMLRRRRLSMLLWSHIPTEETVFKLLEAAIHLWTLVFPHVFSSVSDDLIPPCSSAWWMSTNLKGADVWDVFWGAPTSSPIITSSLQSPSLFFTKIDKKINNAFFLTNDTILSI